MGQSFFQSLHCLVQSVFFFHDVSDANQNQAEDEARAGFPNVFVSSTPPKKKAMVAKGDERTSTENHCTALWFLMQNRFLKWSPSLP